MTVADKPTEAELAELTRTLLVIVRERGYGGPFGLFVGGCVERGPGSSFRRQAHAHAHPTSARWGWVCVRSWRRLLTASGAPSQLLLHELAHVITGQGHTDRWRAEARALGYRLPAHYAKAPRPRLP